MLAPAICCGQYNWPHQQSGNPTTPYGQPQGSWNGQAAPSPNPQQPAQYSNNPYTNQPNPSQPYPSYGNPAAARTAPATGAGGTRQINFPRDPGDDVDVLKAQVFLDYHGYSVGEIDGQWGYNTERALFVYQKNNALPATGQLDDTVLQRMSAFKDGFLLDYTVTPDDLKGPFYSIPRTYPEQSKMKNLPYESAAEALGEKFHCSQTLLKKLNPGIDLNALQPGQKIYGLNTTEGIDDRRGQIGKLRISKSNKWIEAYDSENRFMFYFPCTLGTIHDDIPAGMYEIKAVVYNPPFRYKPELMWDDELKQTFDIPPGPNSPVGNTWIQTSRPSVGIHGTPNPENISKNNSHGCIRTCNWDTRQIAKRVGPATPLEFVP
jgi:hypothetical protein